VKVKTTSRIPSDFEQRTIAAVRVAYRKLVKAALKGGR